MFLIRKARDFPASGLREVEADADTGVVDTAAAVEGVAAPGTAAAAAPTVAGAARSEDAAAAESEAARSEDAAAAESEAVHSEDAAAAAYGLGRCQSANSRRSQGSPREQGDPTKATPAAKVMYD